MAEIFFPPGLWQDFSVLPDPVAEMSKRQKNGFGGFEGLFREFYFPPFDSCFPLSTARFPHLVIFPFTVFFNFTCLLFASPALRLDDDRPQRYSGV